MDSGIYIFRSAAKIIITKIDNCKFNNVNYGIYGSSTGSQMYNITDSYFNDFSFGIYSVSATIINCKFENFDFYVTYSVSRKYYIKDSEIIMNSIYWFTCLVVNEYSVIINNNITNCTKYGIHIPRVNGNIMYNNFINNRYAISIGNDDYEDSGNGNIMYNNFYNNEINIRIDTFGSFMNGYLNYWGIDQNNQTLISNTIWDACQNEDYSCMC